MTAPPTFAAATDADADDVIGSLEALEARLAQPSPAALRKVSPTIHPLYRRMIEASPFAILATSGPGGLDASPRGDPAGFITVADDKTLWLPERRGNHRADSLRNLVADPRLALLLLVPGLGETLRINGRGRLRTAPALLERFSMQGRPPFCVIEISVAEVYFQCARAILRSGLWQPAPSREALGLPTAGEILTAMTRGEFDGQAYDRELPARQRATLY